MREIQKLTRNVSRGMQRFDEQMNERSEGFRRIFGWLDSPANAFGLRLTAIPFGDFPRHSLLLFERQSPNNRRRAMRPEGARHGEPLVCLNSAAVSPPVGRRQVVANPGEPLHEMRAVEGDHHLSNQT